MGAPVRHAASLEEIAQAEGVSIGAAHMLLTRALRKLRANGLLCTCAELARQLDANRNDAHVVVRRTARGR
jgi:hypothetical protein